MSCLKHDKHHKRKEAEIECHILANFKPIQQVSQLNTKVFPTRSDPEKVTVHDVSPCIKVIEVSKNKTAFHCKIVVIPNISCKP